MGDGDAVGEGDERGCEGMGFDGIGAGGGCGVEGDVGDVGEGDCEYGFEEGEDVADDWEAAREDVVVCDVEGVWGGECEGVWGDEVGGGDGADVF